MNLTLFCKERHNNTPSPTWNKIYLNDKEPLPTRNCGNVSLCVVVLCRPTMCATATFHLFDFQLFDPLVSRNIHIL